MILPPTYPDVVPILSLHPLAPTGERLEGDDEARLLSELKTEAENNVGMAMIFTLVSQLKEGLNEIIAKRQLDQSRILELKALAIEEKEQEKFRGQKVDLASFTAWKARFTKEMEAEARTTASANESHNRKVMTGKQMFLLDRSLANDQGDVADDDVVEKPEVAAS